MSIVGSAAISAARRAAGSSGSAMPSSRAVADSIPASCSAPNRRARLAAVVDGTGGTADNRCHAASGR